MKRKLLPFQVIIGLALILAIVNIFLLLSPGIPVSVRDGIRGIQIFMNMVIIMMAGYVITFYDIV